MSAQDRLESWKTAQKAALADTPGRKRLELLFDQGSYVEVDGFASVDGKPSGVVCGYGAVQGSPVYAFAQDSTENAGSVGKVHARKIAKIYDMALKTGSPVVGIYDSMGARVSEGVDALSAYGEILFRVNNLSGVVPQIAVVLGVCAGTSAMLACSADFVVMSKNAQLFMAPPSIANDAPGAGTAENAAKAGVAHLLAQDEQDALDAARKMLSLLPLNNLALPPVQEFSHPDGANALTAACQGAPSAQDMRAIAAAICDEDSVMELLADFGPGAYAALATMEGVTCGILATCPGTLDADSCAKIAKVVSVCDSFQIPVITFVNTGGFALSAQGELCGSVREMAKLSHVYAEATTPKIAVITGEAIGAAYVALCSRAANADYTIAWPSAVISALAPETAVAFLHGDAIAPDKSRQEVVADYISQAASPLNAAATGAIDDVIDPANTRELLLCTLELLSAKRVSKLPKKHGNIPM